jgi:hypothetical protein
VSLSIENHAAAPSVEHLEEAFIDVAHENHRRRIVRRHGGLIGITHHELGKFVIYYLPRFYVNLKRADLLWRYLEFDARHRPPWDVGVLRLLCSQAGIFWKLWLAEGRHNFFFSFVP